MTAASLTNTDAYLAEKLQKVQVDIFYGLPDIKISILSSPRSCVKISYRGKSGMGYIHVFCTKIR